ncbi:hypothetical protein [Ruegeria arenilitoris]|uniref:hypothetical protein n=1 Tax=Ruegeria arenilitoris TaxID=1173585 RepID=UPI00147B98E1|nr:hypothetical protein [Ruegeria arenilitoris]
MRYAKVIKVILFSATIIYPKIIVADQNIPEIFVVPATVTLVSPVDGVIESRKNVGHTVLLEHVEVEEYENFPFKYTSKKNNNFTFRFVSEAEIDRLEHARDEILRTTQLLRQLLDGLNVETTIRDPLFQRFNFASSELRRELEVLKYHSKRVAQLYGVEATPLQIEQASTLLSMHYPFDKQTWASAINEELNFNQRTALGIEEIHLNVDPFPWQIAKTGRLNDLSLLRRQEISTVEGNKITSICRAFQSYWDLVLDNNLENNEDRKFLQSLSVEHGLNSDEFHNTLRDLDCDQSVLKQKEDAGLHDLGVVIEITLQALISSSNVGHCALDEHANEACIRAIFWKPSSGTGEKRSPSSTDVLQHYKAALKPQIELCEKLNATLGISKPCTLPDEVILATADTALRQLEEIFYAIFNDLLESLNLTNNQAREVLHDVARNTLIHSNSNYSIELSTLRFDVKPLFSDTNRQIRDHAFFFSRVLDEARLENIILKSKKSPFMASGSLKSFLDDQENSANKFAASRGNFLFANNWRVKLSKTRRRLDEVNLVWQTFTELHSKLISYNSLSDNFYGRLSLYHELGPVIQQPSDSTLSSITMDVGHGVNRGQIVGVAKLLFKKIGSSFISSEDFFSTPLTVGETITFSSAWGGKSGVIVESTVIEVQQVDRDNFFISWSMRPKLIHSESDAKILGYDSTFVNGINCQHILPMGEACSDTWISNHSISP